MIPEINVVINNSCNIHIQDNTLYSEQPGFEYTKSEVYTVIVIQRCNSNIKYTYIHEVTSDFEIPFLKDGAYNILFMLIPNKKITTFSEINYYTDGEHFYKDDEIVSIDEIIEVNKDITNILYTELTSIITCLLKKCYVNLCNNISLSKCDLGEFNFNKDLVWMTLNIITYLSEFDQLDEINNILDLINGCNGICKQTNRVTNSNECGCS